jgi:hypothetical protein
MSSYFSENQNSQDSNSSPSSQIIPPSQSICNKIYIYFNAIQDKILIYKTQRWILILILSIIYFIRMMVTNGYYALTYCLGIHFLNSFIGFISPLDDPDENENNMNENESYLPQRNNEEFKPFQRKVKEFQFWSAMFWTLFLGIIFTFFDCFDIPVFWPLLLFYFIFIFILTMRNQIKHMIKYNYLPWDTGKKIFGVKS